MHPRISSKRHERLNISICKVTTTALSDEQRYQQQEQQVSWSIKPWYKLEEKSGETILFLVDLGLQLEPSKLYFCGHKIRFAPSKVTCRLLPQRSDKSLFRFAKEDVLKENEPTKGNCGYKLPCYKASWSSDWLFSVTSIHLSLKQCYLRLLNDNT